MTHFWPSLASRLRPGKPLRAHHGEERDIFERLFVVRLDRIRELQECRDLVEPLDDQGLLTGAAKAPLADTEELDDDALLAELGIEVEAPRSPS